MIFNHPERLTKLDIWAVRYKETHTGGEWEVLINDYHVTHASPWVLIEFTKAKHLKGQRFCIKRTDIQNCPTEIHKAKSGKQIRRYVVPFSKLEGWDTVEEVKETINSFGW